MATRNFTPSQLAQFLESDPRWQIVAPDKYGQRFLHQELNNYYAAQGLQVWPAAKIKTLRLWKREEWESLARRHPLPPLIDRFSETLIWGQLLRQWSRREGKELLNVRGTAHSLEECWGLLCRYNALPPLPNLSQAHFERPPQSWSPLGAEFWKVLQGGTADEYLLSSDHTFFLDLVRRYLEYQKERGMLSEFLLPNALLHFWSSCAVDLRDHPPLLWLNFYEIVPQTARLIERLRQVGLEVEVGYCRYPATERIELAVNADSLDSSPTTPTPSWEEEVQLALEEARPHLGETLLVVPQLQEKIEPLRQLLDRALLPQAQYLGWQDMPRPYQAWTGPLLMRQGLGHDLSTLLKLHRGPVDKEDLLNLLSNSFLWGAKREYFQRLLLYRLLESDPRPQFTAAQLYQLARRQRCRLLGALLAQTTSYIPNQVEASRRQWRRQRRLWLSRGGERPALPAQLPSTLPTAQLECEPSAWAEYAISLLLTWFPLAPLYRRQHNQAQIISTYLAELRQFYKLSASYYQQKISWSDFLYFWTLSLATTRLGPAKRVTSPTLRVVSLEQALNLRAERILLLDFNDRHFPAQPRYKGFLPQAFLADLGWPYATPESCLAHSQKQWERLTNCAPQVRCYWSTALEQEGQLLEVNLSPLAKQLPLIPIPQAHPPIPAAALGGPSLLEERPDYPPPPALPNRTAQGPGAPSFKGGVGLLNDQLNCPRKAFLVHRLGCQYPAPPKVGLDVRLDRGTLLHRLMELFWRHLADLAQEGEDSRATLCRLGPAQWHTILENLKEEELKGEAYRSFSPLVLANEGQLVVQLLEDWLQNYESQRGPFQVAALEERLVISLPAPPPPEPGPAPNLEVVRAQPPSQLTFNGRLDRLDRLPGPQGPLQLVVDYKTGRASSATPQAWNLPPSERQLDYQLPLYALSLDPPAQGLQFAKLSAQPARSESLASPQLTPSLPTAKQKLEIEGDWEGRLEGWRQTLEGAATQFLYGPYPPTPHPQFCQRCHLQRFCQLEGTLPLKEEED